MIDSKLSLTNCTELFKITFSFNYLDFSEKLVYLIEFIFHWLGLVMFNCKHKVEWIMHSTEDAKVIHFHSTLPWLLQGLHQHGYGIGCYTALPISNLSRFPCVLSARRLRYGAKSGNTETAVSLRTSSSVPKPGAGELAIYFLLLNIKL